MNMKKLLFITILIAFRLNANASMVYASSFGWNSEDATSAFQNAVNSGADTIVVDKQAGDWNVGPNIFFDLQDKTIIFQPGVVFKAKTGAFPDNGDCLLRFVRASNIRIFGYGATFQMNKAEYAALADGEWRMGLSINNSSNIEVYGLRINESGGDGVYISGDDWFGEQLYSENIILKDVWCDNQYRQGISIISAQHVLVQNCWFTNTSGTLPMSGVDLEPDSVKHRMADVVFDRCRFTGNFGNGIQLSFGNLDTSSIPVDVTFRDCYLSGNHDVSNSYSAAEINMGAAERDAVKGTAKFERCMVENSQWTAVSMRKPADSYLASFNDCVFLNVSQNSGRNYNSPIWIEVTDYSNPCPRFGGTTFKDCLISYTRNFPILGSYGNIATSPGMGNVQLINLTVIHPKSSISINITEGGGSPDTTCHFDFHKFKKVPVTHIDFTAQNSIVECSKRNSLLESTRIADTVNFPVGITYTLEGSAVEGEDYGRMSGFMIIPANLTSNRDTLFVLKDAIAEEPKSIDVTPVTSPLFITASLPQNITVSDCVTGIYNIPGDIFTVFPNPAFDFVEIRFTDEFKGEIRIMNDRGQLVLSQQGQGKLNRISTHDLAKGIYFITIRTGERTDQQEICKLIKM
jgi:hypothetical protein